DDASGLAFQRARPPYGEQGPGDPHQQGQRHQPEEVPQPPAEQESKDVMNHCGAPSTVSERGTGGTISVISTRRLRARPAAVSLGATGSASPRPSARTRCGLSRRDSSSSFTASARACDKCQFDG